MNKETLWLERLKKYMQDHDTEFVCSWWLRLEYKNETPTSQINYWLKKSVAKGLITVKTTHSYSEYSLPK